MMSASTLNIARKLFFLPLLVVLLLPSNADAQYYSFGRNKVQYNRFDWKIMKTEHFDIYYYNNMGKIAEIGAAYAEEAFEKLKQDIGYIVNRRIPLIFYNTSLHFQQTNTTPGFIPEGVGGFFEFLKGRVVIPYSGSLAQFKHVITHELVHVFMVSKVMSVNRDHHDLNAGLPPLWFVEGIAEHYSTDWDESAEMIMRDAVLNNFFFDLNNIYAIYGSFLMYKEGQSFMRFVTEQYGYEKIPLMLRNFWMYEKFNDLIEYVLGEPFEKINAKWTAYEKKRYYPLIEKHDPVSLHAKTMTKRGYSFNPVAFTSDSTTWIYFIANLDGYTSIYRKELLDSLTGIYGDAELYQRGETKEEFESFHVLQPALDISAKGEMAFVTKSGATDAIHLMDVETKKKRLQFQRDYLISITAPRFSEDGSLLLFQATDDRGFSDIYLLNIEAGIEQRLTDDYYNDRDPVFAPGGKQVVFVSDRTAGEFERSSNLFSLDLSTREIDYLTYLETESAYPFFSPDSSELYFTATLDGVHNLYSLPYKPDAKENTVHHRTSYLTSIFAPSFIDEKTLTFSGFEKFSIRLYTSDVPEDTLQSYPVKLPEYEEQWSARRLERKAERKPVAYEKKYSLDYAQSRITTDPLYGTRGGGLLSISDMLGDDKFFLLLYNSAQVRSEFLESFNIDLFRLRQGERANHGYGVFHFSGRRYDLRDPDEYYHERSFGGYFVMQFPLSTFSRFETSVTLANSDKEVISNVIERKAVLWSNAVSYIFDNSLWGYTGPVDGQRFRLTLAYTSDIKHSNVNYYSVIADYRHYLRLALRSTLAFRGAVFYNDGKDARRYFMGGSWDLRGWPRWSIRGEKMWLSSMELRFPLLDRLILGLPFFDIGFAGIKGAAFFDAGSAWDNDYDETLGSIGMGIRFNFLGAIVFRYDIGKKIENNFSTLQPGLFYQFFFGYDF